MILTDFVFTCLAVTLLISAFMAVWLKNVFYNALFLILSLFCVACLFIFLNSEFLAIIEVLIYIGAIAIAIIFVIMLSRPMFQKDEKRQGKKIAAALFIVVVLFLTMLKAFHHTDWPKATVEGNYSIPAIGASLLTQNVLAFEVISIILLIAIIGALVLSNKKRENS